MQTTQPLINRYPFAFIKKASSRSLLLLSRMGIPRQFISWSKKWKKFSLLETKEKKLFFEATWCLAYQWCKSKMLYSPPGEEEFFQSNAPYSQYSPEELLKISQSISRACTLFPQGPTCLIKALAGRQMLVQRRLPFELKLGVKKGEEENKFEFHAWLVAGETCITGEETKHQFAPFSTK